MIAEHLMMTEVANEYDIETVMLDLHPYIDREPCLVLAGSSIRAAHKMIRSGHETVYVCEKVDVVGTVKRRDILPGMLEIALHEKDEQLIKGNRKRKIRQRPQSESSMTPLSELSFQSFTNKDPNADSNHHITMFEPRFYELLYDFIFHKKEHKYLDAQRKGAYGGRISEESSMMKSIYHDVEGTHLERRRSSRLSMKSQDSNSPSLKGGKDVANDHDSDDNDENAEKRGSWFSRLSMIRDKVNKNSDNNNDDLGNNDNEKGELDSGDKLPANITAFDDDAL